MITFKQNIKRFYVRNGCIRAFSDFYEEILKSLKLTFFD